MAKASTPKVPQTRPASLTSLKNNSYIASKVYYSCPSTNTSARNVDLYTRSFKNFLTHLYRSAPNVPGPYKNCFLHRLFSSREAVGTLPTMQTKAVLKGPRNLKVKIPDNLLLNRMKLNQKKNLQRKL